MSDDLKLQRVLLKKHIEKMTSVPTFKGIPVDNPCWIKEDLVALCTVFAAKMKDFENKYYEALGRIV